MALITKVLLTALTLLLVASLVPGVEVTGLYAAIISAIVLGLLNVFVRPILFILTLPITLITLGFFILVINAGLFIFAASLVSGFSVDGFLPALIGSVIVSIVSTISNRYL